VKAFALYGKEDMRLEEMELPALERGALFLRVLACAVCGSDARMFFNGPTARYTLPIVLGHEFVAQVEAVGEGVDGYSVGDLVGANSVIPCMRCPACTSGKNNICYNQKLFGVHIPGGFAEYVYVPPQMVAVGGIVRLPAGVDLRAAALTEVLACCVHGLRQVGGVDPNDEVLIVGDGAVGLTFLQLALLAGARRVVTSGRRPRRRELATALGAHETIDAKQWSLADYARAHGLQPSLAIVAASSPEATAEALAVVRPGGRVLLFSGYLPGTSVPLDVNAVHYRETLIVGSIDSTLGDFHDAAALLPRLRMGELVTHAYPFAQTVSAFYSTREQDAVRVLVTMDQD